jgi:spore coat polysaccharide biosynthesis predicted glycosyltransferase SpsG
MIVSNAKSVTNVSAAVRSYPGKSCLWIRTAAGPVIGFGHLRRSIILAQALCDCAIPVFLLDREDGWSQQQLADLGFDFITDDFNEVWTYSPGPVALLIDTRIETGLGLLISTAKDRGIPVISIHDLGLNPLPSDVVIDGSILQAFTDFPRHDATIFSGTSYLVLDPIYGSIHQQLHPISKKIESVFVNLGGGDSRKHYLKVLEALKLWARELDVIGVSGFSSWNQKHVDESDWNPLHFSWISQSIPNRLCHADLAITTGGLAAYEALCTGTPLLALSYDRLQQITITTLAKAGACIDLGLGDDLDPAKLPELLSSIESDRESRERFSMRGRWIVDGRGTERVARILRRIIKGRTAAHSEAIA